MSYNTARITPQKGVVVQEIPLLNTVEKVISDSQGIDTPPLQSNQIHIRGNMQGGQNMNPQMQMQMQMMMQQQMMQQQQNQQQFGSNQMMRPGMMQPGGYPNQMNMMQGGGMNVPVKPPVQLTPEEIARRKRRAEERIKFKRFIPEEDPKNLEVQGGYQSTLYKCGECCGTCGQCCCCCQNPQVQINQSYKGIYERFGKYVKTVDSGMHFVNPCTDTLIPIDCKTQNIDLGMQSALTRDNILLFVHGVVQYKIIDCRQAHYSITNTDYSVKELSICGLRSIISLFNYQSLLENRELFKRQMEEFVDEYIHDWGVDVEQIIIKDMNMDPKISESLSSAAKEVRLAQAKILNAKADVAAAEQQKKAAEQLSSRPAMQIRFLSTLERIASKSKVVFLGD